MLTESDVSNPDVVVIDKNAMQPYISYVVSTYGKTFIELYEDVEDRVHGEQVDSKSTPTSDG